MTHATATAASVAMPKRQSKTNSSAIRTMGAVTVAARSGMECPMNCSIPPTLSSMIFEILPVPSLATCPRGILPRWAAMSSFVRYCVSNAAAWEHISAAR